MATATGAEVGWVDLCSGDHAVLQPAFEAAFTSTVREWLDQHPGLAITDFRPATPDAQSA